MMKHTKRILIQIIAVVFLILGVIGLALPFFQGLLFILIGLILLSIYNPGVKQWSDSILGRYPALKKPIDSIEQFFIRIIGQP